jgi:predicted ATPase/DNA-binding SARP family transcriptional activator
MWEVKLFGSLTVCYEGDIIVDSQSRKGGLLLGYLACHPEKKHRREFLTDLLWPESTTEAGQNAFRVMLTRLRSQFHAKCPLNLIGTNRTHVWLEQEVCQTDIHLFRQLAQHFEPKKAQQTIESYRGVLLEGYDDEWIIPLRQHFEQQHNQILQKLIQHAKDIGDDTAATQYAYRLVQVNRFEEDAYYRLIEMYLKMGRVSLARDQYQEMERRFHTELGIAPSEKIKSLLPPLPKTPAGSKTYSLDSQTTITQNFPIYLDTFIERQKNISEIITLLHTGHRLVTITGFGGMGKTRLAFEAGQHIASNNNFGMIAWANCLPATVEHALWQALHTALDTNDKTPNRCTDQEVVTGSLAKQSTLLILDNLEQLTDEILHQVIKSLLKIPTVSLLATSRRRLHLSGEQVYPLESFALPQSTDTAVDQITSSSMRLLLDRIHLAQPHFSVNGSLPILCDLCYQLEGVPLAIEMAAARTRILSPQQILDYLKLHQNTLTNTNTDIPERHRSLQTTLLWSYNLLSTSAKQLLSEISVLGGKWTIEASEAISTHNNILDTLTELVDASLVRVEQGDEEKYFSLLETVREFGITLLSKQEYYNLRNRHSQWVYRHLDSINLNKMIVNKISTRDKIRDNFLSALDWTFNNTGQPEIGLGIMTTLRGHWSTSGNISAGIYWHKKALEHVSLHETSEILIATLISDLFTLVMITDNQEHVREVEDKYASLHLQLTDIEASATILEGIAALKCAQEDLQEARVYYKKAHNLRGTNANFQIVPLMNLAQICHNLSEWEECIQIAHQGLTISKDDPRSNGVFLFIMSCAETSLSQFENAKKHLDQAMEYFRMINEKMGICRVTDQLGNWHLHQNEFMSASKCFRAAGVMATQFQDGKVLKGCLLGMAKTTLHLGNARRAMRIFGVHNKHVQNKRLEIHMLKELAQLRDEIEVALGGDAHDDFTYGMALSSEAGLKYAFETDDKAI